MDTLALILFFTLVGLFVLRAWRAHGWLAAHDRWGLITSFVVATTTFPLALLLINWVIVSTLIWLIAVALLAGGVIGVALRWPELAWFAGAHPLRRAIGSGAMWVICALLLSVALL